MTLINMMSSPAKRKRDEPSSSSSSSSQATFSFYAPTPLVAAVAAAADVEDADGGSSPRTRVASRFGSLVIGEREHKRMRASEASERSEDAEGNTERSEGGNNDPVGSEDNDPVERSEDYQNDANTIERSENNSDTVEQNEDNNPPTRPIYNTPIDPLRASLTWQDDEITVYDPNDKDDDGTGVNGIGFKPTPAIAHARALKRRQQLADYRKREEREARARRSRRRPRVYGSASSARAGPAKAGADAADVAKKETPGAEEVPEETTTRRVRFLETGPVTIRFLEPEMVI